MNDQPPKPPVPEGPYRTPRSEAIKGLLLLAEDLFIARFALTRALEHLDLLGLLEVYSEVFETVDDRTQLVRPRLITPRDEKS